MKTLKFLVPCILITLPILFYFWYISANGTNVIVADEWHVYIPLFKKLSTGTLTIADLFNQHNEHRIFFPRLIFLFFGYLTHFNTKAFLYFSASLLVLTLIGIFISYTRFFGVNKESIWKFLPVCYLLFSLVQFENTLWGFQMAWYMVTFFSVLSFIFLENVYNMTFG